MSHLKGKHILIGMTGGIAAYKVAYLVSMLKKLGAEVEVMMTEGAEAFITPLTMQTMSQRPVHTSQFSLPQVMDVEHISLAKWADLLVICPATANTMAKLAHGIADNLITTVALAYEGPKMVVPAMNTAMWKHQATQENVKKLSVFGYRVLTPASGLLACGDVGEGKMPEPQSIVEEMEYAITPKDLSGYHFIVTAGPTMEPLDPVRYLTNHSSGKMGYAIAKEARMRGARVTLIKGYTSNPEPHVEELVTIKTTRELLAAVEARFDEADAVIMPAAPLDYRPATVATQKIKKDNQGDDGLHLDFIPNPDVAATIGKRKNKQILVGFAAETNDVIENATAKIKKKNLDFIVANNLTTEGAGFKQDTNIITILTPQGEQLTYDKMAKQDVARIIVDRVKNLLDQRK